MPHGVNQILFGVFVRKSVMFFCNSNPILYEEKFIFCQFHILAKFRKNHKNTIVIITGAKIEIRFFFLGLKNLSNNEFNTTETELIAIANQANSGLSVSHSTARAPHAMGIHNML